MDNKNILVIEQNTYERTSLIMSLLLDGHTVFEAKNENEALDLILGFSSQNQIDIIIDFEIAFKNHKSKVLMNLCHIKFGLLPAIISNTIDLHNLLDRQEAV